MMKYNITKYAITCLIAITIILASGCDLINEPSNVKEGGEGKNGIEINFLSGFPPNKIYEKEALDVIIEVRNKGVISEPEGKIYFYGYDANIMKFSTDSEGADIGEQYSAVPLPKVQPKNSYLPQGGYDSIKFSLASDNFILKTDDNYKPTLSASVCYMYKTVATPTVCILPRDSATTKNKVCTPETITLTKGQGSPISVTKIEPEIISNKVNFVVTISNDGRGVVVNKEDMEKSCPFNLDESKINSVDMNMRINGLADPTCQPSKTVNLIDGKGTMHCTFETQEGMGGYSTPLKIEVDYGYHDKIETKIEVINIPGEEDSQHTYQETDGFRDEAE